MENMRLKPIPTEESKYTESYGPNYEPKEPTESDRKTICKTVKKFALDETTAHGFPNIFRARTHLGRLAWTAIFLAGVVGTIYQGTLLVQKYSSYPVNVEVKIVTRPSLKFPSVTVCNTNKLRLSAIDKSKYRQMLVVDQTASLPYYAPCLEGDFACNLRPVCIKKYLLCDGIRQCGKDDASDEQGCNYESRTCTARQFRCGISGSNSGICIPARKKCNRRKDCYEGEDEDDCQCKKSEFKCEKRGGCIPKRKVCDGKTDCLDGSDEGKQTCGDRDDSFRDCNSDHFFNCFSGDQCVLKRFMCDDFPDCRDRSDEDATMCGSRLVTEDVIFIDVEDYLPTCAPGQFRCSVDGNCIPEGWTCDGSLECTDGSDEALELCGRPLCTSPKSPCAVGGSCGTPCDLHSECVSGIDELNCTCRIYRADNHEVLIQKLTCGDISSEKYYHAADHTYQTSCGTGSIHTVQTSYYHCGGRLDCYNPTTMLPEPCKTVISECYTSSNGRDYRGNKTQDECLSWSHPLVASLNYTGQNYWELEGVEPGSTVEHSFCRNPGGEFTEPWCFVGIDGESYNIMPCMLPQPPSVTCHSETFEVSIPSDDSEETPSQGRIEVSFRTEARGTISDPDWTLNDAHVVCRQLGFPAGALVNASTDFGPGTGRVLLRDVQCEGTEPNLIDCFYRLASEQDTDHTYDVGVVCNDSLTSPERRKRSVDDVADIDFSDSEACSSCSAKRQENIPSPPSETSPGCGDNGFVCQSGECVRNWQICNHFPDCQDGSDELLPECENILTPTDCTSKEFQCTEPKPDGTNQCILKSLVCDGYNDCGNKMGHLKPGMPRASDELACPRREEKPPSNYFSCQSTNKFIHEYDVCNTVEDCIGNGNDEEDCYIPRQKEPFKEVFQDPRWYWPYSKMLNEKQHDLFKNFTSEFRTPPFGRVKGEDPPDWNGFVTFSATPDYSDLVDIAKLSKDEVSRFGHQKEDFILQCTYEQRKCNISDFKELQDDNYGNCFTFNANEDRTISASKTGSRYGLQMTLYLEQNEYISIYGQEAGVRVSIDPPHIRPNPTDNGITVQPGAVTSIGLRYNYVVRKGHPYGTCRKIVKNTKIIDEGKIKTSSSELYDRNLCKKTCVHEHILKYCGCSDTLELNGARCKLLNETQEVCRQLVHYLSQHNKLTCFCPEQCSDVHYTKTSSMSKWPSKKFAKHLLRNIQSINEKTQQLNEENVFDNIVRLEVYYEELNYESTKEVPAYQEFSLFGDIGGIVGLYIGFSLITVCEFIALALKLIKRFFCSTVVKV